MVKNTVQFQGGLSLPRSPATCGTEEQRRLALFAMLRPQGFRCPKCGHKHCSALQSRKLYQCRHRFQVSLTQGTIFASIKLLLPIWMLAIYLVTPSTPRAASSFSLCAVPWSTGAQRLSAGFYFFRHTPFNWIYWPAGVFSRAFCPASCSTACSCVLFRLAISS